MPVDPRESITEDLLTFLGIKKEVVEKSGEENKISENKQKNSILSDIRSFYSLEDENKDRNIIKDKPPGTHLVQAGYYVLYNIISGTLYFIISSDIKNSKSLKNLSITFSIIGLILVIGIAYHLIKAGFKLNKYLENTNQSSLNEHNS